MLLNHPFLPTVLPFSVSHCVGISNFALLVPISSFSSAVLKKKVYESVFLISLVSPLLPLSVHPGFYAFFSCFIPLSWCYPGHQESCTRTLPKNIGHLLNHNKIIPFTLDLRIKCNARGRTIIRINTNFNPFRARALSPHFSGQPLSQHPSWYVSGYLPQGWLRRKWPVKLIALIVIACVPLFP